MSWYPLRTSCGRTDLQVLPLITPPEISESLRTNLHSALTLSLLLLPPTFTEQALWTQIAGISYAGDTRMSVPGAEHPDKVANIVKGKGALEGMRGLYGQFMGRGELALVWDRGEKRVEEPEVGKGWTWRGTGEEVLRVSWRSFFDAESREHLTLVSNPTHPTISLLSSCPCHATSGPEYCGLTTPKRTLALCGRILSRELLPPLLPSAIYCSTSSAERRSRRLSLRRVRWATGGRSS